MFRNCEFSNCSGHPVVPFIFRSMPLHGVSSKQAQLRVGSVDDGKRYTAASGLYYCLLILCSLVLKVDMVCF